MFDMDGTLIDTQALIAEHMATTFAEADLVVPTPAQVRRIIGLSLPQAMLQLLGSQDIETANQLAERYRAHYRDSLVAAEGREGLFPGAREALHLLHGQAETVMGIATGKGLQGVHRLTQMHEIAKFFSTLQTPDHNPSKPHPGMMLRAMGETGADPSQTVIIGDTSFDMEMGKAAGTKTIGVTWGYHHADDLRGAGADILIESYDALAAAIDQVLET
ncbi:HAD-IA family hydrolase [Devosia sp. XJ19-1]|uniref:HAD-IA family hydrolase n=1 Tax=Devosia ureilytica TaxID=2952754 RepID=A0A9Q4FRS0_9HYPH|nr:HAD-IA family hydrolase [Devosia ureilytica]MCP8882010.1 HAD-IA family hydrolase [Devosia ureilytica]MCP8886104.1 HAD-IA family hydrolase [Devosia ureilytica]